MSSQPPPDPVTTVFNPEAWIEPTGLFTKLRGLYQNYVSYPIAQNYPITFSILVFATDAALTKMANTSYVIANLVPYLVSLLPNSQTWLAVQNFTGIETNTINPIGAGTLLIGTGVNHDIRIASQNSRSVVLHLGDGDNNSGGIHINNGANCLGNVNILNGTGSTGTITLGTRRITPSVSTTTTTLGCPLKILYTTYPISVTGAIGYVIPTTTVQNPTLPSGGGSSSVRSVVIPTDGIWALYGELLGPESIPPNTPPYSYPGTFYGISFTTGINGGGTFIGQQKTGQQIPPTTNIFSATYFIAARLTAGTIYLNGRSQTSYTIGSSKIIALRLA